jgi:hypothetical protein
VRGLRIRVAIAMVFRAAPVVRSLAFGSLTIFYALPAVADYQDYMARYQ